MTHQLLVGYGLFRVEFPQKEVLDAWTDLLDEQLGEACFSLLGYTSDPELITRYGASLKVLEALKAAIDESDPALP